MPRKEFFSADITNHHCYMNNAVNATATAYRDFSPKSLTEKQVVDDLLNGSHPERHYVQIAAFPKKPPFDMAGTARVVLTDLEVLEQFDFDNLLPKRRIAEVARLTVIDREHTLDILPVIWKKIMNVANCSGVEQLIAIMTPRVQKVVSYAGIRTEVAPGYTLSKQNGAINVREKYKGYWGQGPIVWEFIDYPSCRNE